jgi:hypothetical protein
MFSSGAYRLIVAIEVLGVRQFWAGFYWLGAALIAGGIVGAAVGLVGGSAGAIS